MSPLVKAVWVAGASGFIGVVVGVTGTVIVAVFGFRSTRKATADTIEAGAARHPRPDRSRPGRHQGSDRGLQAPSRMGEAGSRLRRRHRRHPPSAESPPRPDAGRDNGNRAGTSARASGLARTRSTADRLSVTSGNGRAQGSGNCRPEVRVRCRHMAHVRRAGASRPAGSGAQHDAARPAPRRSPRGGR